MNGIDYTSRNFKRVAEVWLGKYKEVMYFVDPEKSRIDPGDLTKMIMIRDKLQCKPFDYFLEEIAPEMFTRFFYQGRFPGYFGRGMVENVAYPKMCLDTLGNKRGHISLFQCHEENDVEENINQYFLLTWHRSLKLRRGESCLQDNLYFGHCKFDGESSYQSWKYDWDTKQLTNENKPGDCLAADKDKKSTFFTKCDVNANDQKWFFSIMNEKALKNYDKIYFKDNHFFGMDYIS